MIWQLSNLIKYETIKPVAHKQRSPQALYFLGITKKRFGVGAIHESPLPQNADLIDAILLMGVITE